MVELTTSYWGSYWIKEKNIQMFYTPIGDLNINYSKQDLFKDANIYYLHWQNEVRFSNFGCPN